MNFKKDYINYVLHHVLQSDASTSNTAPGKILEKIIASNDFFQITFIVGKTAGLELLFKYLLYISDKVDKSQITIFNLRDNFEYDVNNIKRICGRLQLKDISGAAGIDEIPESENPEAGISEDAGSLVKSGDKTAVNDELESSEEPDEVTAETAEGHEGMSLLENDEPESPAASELFELENISRSIESHSIEPQEETTVTEKEEITENKDIEESKEASEIHEHETSAGEAANEEITSVVHELEIEVRKPAGNEDDNDIKEDIKAGVTEQDEFNKFEQKYREEIKILEKLLSYVEKECTYNSFKGLNEKAIQSFNEIIEISGELAELTRQLSFDLVADIFYTLNIYFTRAVKEPEVISLERIKLFDSSLAIVSSLIKGENYTDYSEIIDKVEALKRFLGKPAIMNDEKSVVREEKAEESHELEAVKRIIELPGLQVSRKETEEEEETLIEKPKVKKQSVDSIIFKMKYLVKEFEKNFSALENITGEYSKFTALEKIDELNSYLRMLAKISAAVKLKDILQLSEVSYVFLKYLKDYRMDLLDSEIQQIIKYIIFTFKMLLTDRKPEDFNVLVQYLNNPVKIFTDSN